MSDPASKAVVDASRLVWDERTEVAHARALQMHTDLLALRKSDVTLSAHPATGVSLEIATLTPLCGVIRYFVDGPVASAGTQDRLLVVNLGADLELAGPAEPLLSPPAHPGHTCWSTLWSSEDPRYGGNGCAELESEDRGFKIPASAAVLLTPLSIV